MDSGVFIYSVYMDSGVFVYSVYTDSGVFVYSVYSVFLKQCNSQSNTTPDAMQFTIKSNSWGNAISNTMQFPM